jgi:hypothetical protein
MSAQHGKTDLDAEFWRRLFRVLKQAEALASGTRLIDLLIDAQSTARTLARRAGIDTSIGLGNTRTKYQSEENEDELS